MLECVSGRVSVIMPCFNAAMTITESIESVLAQSYHDFELIIIDDGSTDASAKLVNGLGSEKLSYVKQSNRGVCAARNHGLALARGEYVAFLDADDTWEPTLIEHLLDALTRDKESVLAYCGWQNIGLQGKRSEPFVPPDYEVAEKIEILLGGCRWPIHAVLARKAEIMSAGGFDERFSPSEDYLLWLKIASFKKICRVPEVLAYYRHHEGVQATKKTCRVAINRWNVKRTFLRLHPEIVKLMGKKKICELVDGNLMKSALEHYWKSDLKTARGLFRRVCFSGYIKLRYLKYFLPSVLLPYTLHKLIHSKLSKSQAKNND